MKYRYVFFGTPHIAQLSLQALEAVDMLPELIVTAPPKPQGRGMHVTETPVAAFAREHDIPCLTPEKITPEVLELLSAAGPWDFFLVVAYGKILPQSLLDIVQGKVLNLHPSLLPKYRGPSPLESSLLSDDTETGVTIMELDKEVDHGPIVGQTIFPLAKEMTVETLTEKSVVEGIALLKNTIAPYLSGELAPTAQAHDLATHTRKYTKADGALEGTAEDWQKWKIFRAFGDRGWVHFS
ncbi:MAG: fmt, partial [Candidatus Nomurabacteria bacterium]|nr:fmt [Candidatus Nomurabacteria bacterium]